MKNLTKYAVFVNNEQELKIAKEFYRLATKRSVYDQMFSIKYPTYVGMYLRHVADANTKYAHEETVQFSQIGMLADTDYRRDCLNRAFTKYNMKYALATTASTPKKEKREVKSRHMPIAQFLYPKRGTNYLNSRTVLVIDINNKYLTAIEDGKFKRFRRDRIGLPDSRGRVELIGFK